MVRQVRGRNEIGQRARGNGWEEMVVGVAGGAGWGGGDGMGMRGWAEMVSTCEK